MGLFTRSRPIRSLLCWLLLAPLIALNLFPFAVMLSTALRPRDEIFINPQRWLPSRFAFENFTDMWTSVDYGAAVLNSLYVAVASMALVLLVGIPSAYALSRYDFRWKRKYQLFLLITQMVSPIVLVPAPGAARLERHGDVAARACRQNSCRRCRQAPSARPGWRAQEASFLAIAVSWLWPTSRLASKAKASTSRRCRSFSSTVRIWSVTSRNSGPASPVATAAHRRRWSGAADLDQRPAALRRRSRSRRSM
jgi:hypothetical protein